MSGSDQGPWRSVSRDVVAEMARSLTVRHAMFSAILAAPLALVVLMIVVGKTPRFADDSLAEAVAKGMLCLVGVVAVPFVFVQQLTRAFRASESAAIANQYKTVTWWLDGKRLFALDAAGVVMPKRTLVLTRSMCDRLPPIPTAKILT